MNPSRLVLRIAAALGVPLLHLGNRQSVRRTSAAVEAVSSRMPPLHAEPATVVGIASGAASRLRLGATSCIARSQFAYLMVGGRQRGAVVAFGVQPDLGSSGEAHAWLEVDGEPVGEAFGITDLYLPFDRPLLPPG